jgi:VIT1/CCC1 family predicted Fe2+/Mn2+ transporter
MAETALGAGIAWGIIDALLYLVVIVYERNRYIHVADDLQKSQDEKSSLGIIQEDLEDSIIGTLDVEDQERIYRDVLGAQRRVGYADKARGVSSLGREDYLGAFQVFLAMLVATLVVVVPLYVVEPPHVAVIVSNLVALLSLFVVGYLWARHTRINKVKFGVLLAIMGAGIVVITFFLGG